MGIVLKKEVVYQRVKRDIVEGRYAYAEKLPPLLELAEQLGVSMQTMRDAAERLDSDGYIKRVHGRGTFANWDSSRDSRKKYLMLDTLPDQSSSNNVFNPLLMKYAESENILLEVCSYEFIARQPVADSLEYLKRNKIAGIINTASNYTGEESIIEFFRRCEVPVVIPHATVGDGDLIGAAALHPCEFTAFTEGVRYFAEKGHRRIAVLGNCSNGAIRDVTKDAFMGLCEELGCEAIPEYFVPSDYDQSDITTNTNSLMNSPLPPTAILCSSDFYAIYLYQALRKLALSIPRDVAVMGYCNSPGAAVLNPPLSSIDIGYDEAARMAVDLLKDSEEWFGRANVARPEVIVKHNVIERGSSNIKRLEYEVV